MPGSFQMRWTVRSAPTWMPNRQTEPCHPNPFVFHFVTPGDQPCDQDRGDAARTRAASAAARNEAIPGRGSDRQAQPSVDHIRDRAARKTTVHHGRPPNTSGRVPKPAPACCGTSLFWWGSGFCSSHDGHGAVIRDAVVTRPPLRQAPMTERAAVERCKWRNGAGRSTEPITPSTSRCSSPRQMARVNSAHGCCLSSLRCLRGPLLARCCQVMARRAAIGTDTTATFRSAVATWFNKRTDRECLP